jgi:ELWxxDGT repeat protein
MYFSAWSDGNGRELWQTDGTEAGTSMVVDMSANTTNLFGHLIIGSSHPSNLANINGTLYFSAEPWNYLDYSNVGRELWKLTYVPDIFEGINSDDTQGLASVIQLDDTNPQLHNFHDAADKDWIKFFAVGGKKYQIDTGNVGPVVDLVIKIHDGSGILLTTVDQTGQGEVEETEWLAPANGVYYVEFSEKQDLYGSGTEYEATISFKYAPGSFGIIRGIVQSDQGAVKLAGALVTSKINNVTDSAVMTLPDGSYIIVSTAGQINLSTQLSGYLPVTQQGINVLAGSDIEVNLTLSEMPENTDTDGDGIPDDEDDFSDNAAASIDSDSDGLPDEWNAACFLDCLNNSGLTVDNDDDNDGMPDDYEIANDLEPFSDDSLADSDNDGYTNLEEFEAGTAANDANDTPRKSNVILKILPLLLEQ